MRIHAMQQALKLSDQAAVLLERHLITLSEYEGCIGDIRAFLGLPAEKPALSSTPIINAALMGLTGTS